MEPLTKVPRHIAIILDGNGRWAKMRGLARPMGHKEGCKAVEQTVRDCADLGVEYLTVYGFSTENWKRDDTEVSALMQLFRFYVRRLLGIAKENNVKVIMIGDRSRFDADLIEGLNKLESETAMNTRMTFVIALNYGSRDEIRRAVKEIAEDVKAGKVSPDDVSEEMIAAHLDTAGIPDPDLLIRTGGEMRVSNYLLWQLAYTEFYVTDLLWPDFNMDELKKAIESYNGRERRFGGVIQK